MTKASYFRAVIVSAVLAFLAPLLYTVLFGYSVILDPDMRVDPDIHPDQFYEEQEKWRAEPGKWLTDHEKKLNGVQTLVYQLGHKAFWGEYAKSFVMNFFLILVAFISFGFWERCVSRPNPSFKRDA